MTELTGRYTGNSETVMEQDLARLRDVKDAAGFISLLDRISPERECVRAGLPWLSTVPVVSAIPQMLTCSQRPQSSGWNMN
jgi:hypothetical protein